MDKSVPSLAWYKPVVAAPVETMGSQCKRANTEQGHFVEEGEQ